MLEGGGAAGFKSLSLKPTDGECCGALRARYSTSGTRKLSAYRRTTFPSRYAGSVSPLVGSVLTPALISTESGSCDLLFWEGGYRNLYSPTYWTCVVL